MRIHVGPYTQIGAIAVLRLWRWNVIRIGRCVRFIARPSYEVHLHGQQ